MTQIWQYPELILAALLMPVLLLRRSFVAVDQIHLPVILSQPGSNLVNMLPSAYRAWLKRLQNHCAFRSNSAFSDVCGLKLLLLLAGFFPLLFLSPALAIIAAVSLFFAPDLFLVVAAERRRQQIRQALPQALDLMVLCVDAGLGLDATLQRVAAERAPLGHALNEELANLGRDILLGMDRARAYHEVYNRTGVEELKMLGSALNQSTKMGLSIAKILRAQADFLRTRQNQKAEERAGKLPVYISFPLWFCIMPALLLVIMGPSIITLINHLGHVKPDWWN
jgi:tight adherence protein C